MKIKIIKSQPHYWYKVGDTFEVTDYSKTLYMLTDGTRSCLGKQDCEVISDSVDRLLKSFLESRLLEIQNAVATAKELAKEMDFDLSQELYEVEEVIGLDLNRLENK